MSKPTSAATRADGFFAGSELLVRSPVLSLDWLQRWGAELASPEGDAAQRAEQLLGSERVLRERLLSYYQEPLLREALAVASPSLVQALQRWDGDADSRGGQSLVAALTRYFIRMTTRSTPFGLFSSCAMGSTEGTSEIVLSDRSRGRRHARVDALCTVRLAAALEQVPAIRARLKFRPCDALVQWPDRVSFPAIDHGAGRSFSLTALDTDEALLRVLDAARSGQTLDALAQLLQDDDVSFEDARAYCAELAHSGALRSELEPSVWGPEPLQQIAEILSLRAPEAEETQRVARLQAALHALVELPLGAAEPGYERARALLRELPVGDHKSAFQVDLSRPLETSSLPSGVLEELSVALSALERVAAVPDMDILAQFKQDFERRYGDAEVPLLEALDEERGVVFARPGAENRDPAPLLEGLLLRRRQAGRAPSAHPQDAWLLQRLVDIWQRGAQEWSLTAQDLAQLPPVRRLPDAVATLFQVQAPDRAAVERGDYQILLQACWGPSGALLLGRFCHGDPGIEAAARAIVAREEALDPEAIFAEISHVPEGRGGNVVYRPKLRAHHVPYLGGGNGQQDGCIPASDLRVRLVQGSFVLRSERLNRRVVVRLTTAQNHRNSSLAVYRFLCAVQADGLNQAQFHWGSFQNAPFLPRVRVGRVILSPATWLLTPERLRGLAQAGSSVERFERAQLLRAELRLPRHIYLSDGDQNLLIDLDNILCVNVLAADAKRGRGLCLTEAFDPGATGFVRGSDGAYAHELGVPFLRRPSAARRPVEAIRTDVAPSPATPALPARLLPGSEWLSMKFYGGVADLEGVLLDTLLPHVEQALQQQRAEGWFFLRYRDPEAHVRLRLRGDCALLGGQVLPALTRAVEGLVQRGVLRRVEVDTYEREVERYGGPRGMLLSERLFAADSVAAGEVLRSLRAVGREQERWRAVLVGMHQLLADFCHDVEARLATVEELRSVFGEEFYIGTAGERVFGERFRARRLAIERWLAGDFELPQVSAAYAKRSQELAPLVAQLRLLESAGGLSQPLVGRNSMLASYVHMHAVRMFRSHSREQELLLYDFLTRHYRSQLARRRRQPAAAHEGACA